MSAITLISGKSAFISRIFRAGKYLEISRKYPEIRGNTAKYPGNLRKSAKYRSFRAAPNGTLSPVRSLLFAPVRSPPPPTGSLRVLPLLRKSRLRLFGSGYIIILRTGLVPDN